MLQIFSVLTYSLRSLLVAVVITLFLWLPAHASSSLATESTSQFPTIIANYQRHFHDEVLAIFSDKFSTGNIDESSRERLQAATARFETSLTNTFTQFLASYERGFDLDKPDGGAVKEARQHQENLKLAIELVQIEMIGIIQELESPKARSQQVEIHIEKIEELAVSLEESRKISRPLANFIANFIPRREKFLRSLIGFIGHVLKNTNITTLMKWMPLEPFTPQKTPPELRVVTATGERTTLAELPANAVIVLLMNHDVGTLDGYGIQKVSEALGAAQNMVLTTKAVWPQLALFKNKDPDAFLIQEKNFPRRLLERIKARPNERLTFSAFPEGAVAMAGAQFPQIANAGTFKVARDLAAQLHGERPVYYVRLISNFLEHVSTGGEIPMHIELREPELIPTTPVEGRNDPWVSEQRRAFEESSSRNRGRHYDLRNPARPKGYRIFRAGPQRLTCQKIIN